MIRTSRELAFIEAKLDAMADDIEDARDEMVTLRSELQKIEQTARPAARAKAVKP